MSQCHHRRGRIAAALAATVALSTMTALPALADDDQPKITKDAVSRLLPRGTVSSLDAADTYKKGASTAGFTGKWFVQLEAKPVVNGGAVSTIEAQHSAFAAAVADAEVEVENTFGELWTGVTVTADEAALAAVLDADHVKAVFPVVQVARPTEVPQVVTEPNMYSARDISGVSVAQNEYGLSGAGIKIGIIDSGIDIDNTVFGGTGVSDTTQFPNSKVVAGYDFVGDAYNADDSDPNFNPIPAPDPNPDDCGGHGTHVAGIAAGQDTASDFIGVAPEATLGAYRVFGCDGSTDSEIILAAMEKASEDGMDIINMSLGAAFVSWPNYPTSVAADNLAAAGVHVVVAQGNEAEYGLFSGGAPANAREVIAVGSVDNSKVRQPGFAVDGDMIGYSQATAAPAAPSEGELDIAVYPEEHKTGAVDLPGEPFEGKVVLVSRGSSSFYDKALAAQTDGAAAVVIYNNQPGIINATVAGDEEITVPVVTISQEMGLKLEALVANAGDSAVTLTWTSEWTEAEDSNAGLISDFSSWGVSGELDIKPDVLAPGGNIFSAYPLDAADGNGSGFVSMSGTSMASPYTAGSVALLLEANPDLDPATAKTLLQNTAKPVIFPVNLAAEGEFYALEPIHRQGAGLIEVSNAVVQANPAMNFGTAVPVSAVSPAKINLGDGDAIETTPLTITNSGSQAVTYELSVDDSTITTWGPNAEPDYDFMFDLSEGTSFSQASVTVPAGESRTVDVTIAEPTAYWDGENAVEPGSFYGGYVVLTGDDESVLSVPFFGVKGDYETDRGFVLATLEQVYGLGMVESEGADPNALYAPPSLATSCDENSDCDTGYFYFIDGQGYTFDVTAGDIPGVALHIENPIRRLTIEAFHAQEDGSKGAPASEYGPVYVSDGEGATPSYDLFSWDGKIQKSEDPADREPAAEGRYVFEVTATKGMGQATKSENTETWLSQPFILLPEGDSELRPMATFDNGWDGTDVIKSDPLPEAEDYYVGDWDGDGVDSLMWRTGNTFSYINKEGDKPVSFNYGRTGDVALVGDWDGDGKDSVAVRRGVVIYHKNALAGGHADDYFYFGRVDDAPLTGDWDGDGKDTISVRRGGSYFINNKLIGGAVDSFELGDSTYHAVVGDWDSDGIDTISLVDEKVEKVGLNNEVTPSALPTFQDLATSVRGADALLTGDWNGDGTDTLGFVWYAVGG